MKKKASKRSKISFVFIMPWYNRYNIVSIFLDGVMIYLALGLSFMVYCSSSPHIHTDICSCTTNKT